MKMFYYVYHDNQIKFPITSVEASWQGRLNVSLDTAQDAITTHSKTGRDENQVFFSPQYQLEYKKLWCISIL